MNDNRFDRIAKTLGQAASRRTVLKALLGVGSLGAAGTVLHSTDAARRGYSGPTFPEPTEPASESDPLVPEPCSGITCNDGCCDRVCDMHGNCCPPASIVCDGECCPKQQTECCLGVCCQGTCYDGVLCCPLGMGPCPSGGCCDILGPRVGPR